MQPTMRRSRHPPSIWCGAKTDFDDASLPIVNCSPVYWNVSSRSCFYLVFIESNRRDVTSHPFVLRIATLHHPQVTADTFSSPPRKEATQKSNESFSVDQMLQIATTIQASQPADEDGSPAPGEMEGYLHLESLIEDP